MKLSFAAVLLLQVAAAFVAPQSLLPHTKVASALFSATLETEEVATGDGIVSPFSLPQNSPMVQSNKPGSVENNKFRCDPSVAYWQSFDSNGNAGNWQRLRDIVTSHLDTQQSRAYWLSHVLRTSYFTANAFMGLVGHELNENIANRNKPETASSRGFLGGLTESDVTSRLLLEAIKCYEQDWKQVEQGVLRFPWDATIRSQSSRIKIQADHKQNNPFFALSETARLVREAVRVYGRQNRLKGQPAGVWLKSSDKASSSISYPAYYLNDFHYQTDGWMSTESAERYEVSTETLFLGRQDAMQRQTLVPLKNHFRGKDPTNLLEVACGTGRFATFTRDNFRSTNVTLTDLSPFYLEKARRNDKYWRDYQKLDVPVATLVQANAEELPFDDESFEAVTCVYLFHELPEDARARAAAEMARVVKKGGMVVLTDSLQLGDRPPVDKSISGFSSLNEPHYKNYIATDLSALFEKHGLACSEKYMASNTKTLSFIKK